MADEYLDVLDEHGNLTGKRELKSVVHKKGLWHRCSHIWIYNKKGELLLQKRAMWKDVYPGMWDISAAGHIAAGESPMHAALREIEEEIGKKISEKELKEVFIQKAAYEFRDIKVREYDYVFLWRCDDDISTYTKQDGEVEELKFLPIPQVKKELNSFYVKNYVPHGSYYDKVFDAIEKDLKN